MFVFCTVYVYCVGCTLFPPVADICARLAGNFCLYFTTVSCWSNSLVWVAVFYFTASYCSRVGGGGRGSVATLSPMRYTTYTTWPRWPEQGGGLRSLPFIASLDFSVSAAMEWSPLISLRVCHLAMGRRGVASMSDQWRSSAPFAMHPSSTSPALRARDIAG
jgi:hypothetical protein